MLNKNFLKCNFIFGFRSIIFRFSQNAKRLHSSSLPPLISKTGFNDYAEAKRSFEFTVPEKYNFARDVIDSWAAKEVAFQRNTDVPAFWFMYNDSNQIRWNFRELSEKSKRTAYMLENYCSLKQGDQALVILPKIPEYWLVSIAAIRAGIILSPGSMQLTSKDLKYRFQAFKPKCVIAHETVTDAVDEAAEFSPCLKTKVVVTKNGKTRNDWLNFHQLYEKSVAEHKCVENMADDTMMIFFTSGTTGMPKMVEHSFASYGLSLGLTGRYFLDLTPKDVMWNYSDTGWGKTMYSSLFAPWCQGSCVFVHEMPRFKGSVMLQVLSEIPVTTLCAPPTAYHMLIKEDVASYSFKSLSHCVCGGEPLNLEVGKAWMEATNLRIYQGYGQTEMVMLLGMYRCLKYFAGSIGKPSPGIEIAILDENGNELGPNKAGEIALKRSSAKVAGLFKGYADSPERTAACFSGGYYLTGDTAFYDDEGYFWFVSRKDDIINSAGYRIGPYEVESALNEHPLVAESAVTSSPDEIRGEIVSAYIVLKDGCIPKEESALIKELQTHVQKVTAPYKYPRKITFIEELPKTVSGKISRVELKKREWKDIGSKKG